MSGRFRGSLLIPTEGTRLAWIRGQPLLFVPAKQSLFSVDAAAARLWPQFERGLLCRHAPPQTAQVDRDEARIGAQLCEAGALEPLSTEEGAAQVACVETLAIGDVRILASFASAASRNLLMPAFEHLRAPAKTWDECVIVVHKEDRIGVAHRNSAVEWVTEDEAAPVLRIALAEIALDHLDGLALHAATLVRQDAALLLLGAPGAGKSTLAVALSRVGFSIEGDDISALLSDGTVRALPFAVTLKSGAWSLLRESCPGIASSPVFRRPDGKEVRYLPLDPPAIASGCAVRWIVQLDRMTRGEATLTQLATEQVIESLLAGAWSEDARVSTEAFQALATCLDRATAFRLTYSGLQDAVQALDRLCVCGAAGGSDPRSARERA